MSLVARIAAVTLGIFVLAAGVGLLVWRPVSAEAFAARSEEILRRFEEESGEAAAQLVDEVIAYSAAAAVAADERRAEAIAELPLELYADASGALVPERVREAMRALAADPGVSLPEQHAIVHAELKERARRGIDARLASLRASQRLAAERHGDAEARRAVAAWGGLLLLLLAAGALVLERAVVRPVRAVTEAEARFGGGERGIRLPVGGARELRALAASFNAAVAAVERAEAENRDLRALLEEKVRERTSALVRAARAATAGTLAGGVAHEFNNLLQGILGCAQSALDENPPPGVREPLEMIVKTARRGVGVTGAILRATRAAPEKSDCDVAALVDEALAEVRPPAGIEVRRELAATRVRADGAMLRQVLANLLHNSVQAMGARGTLRISARRERDEILLEVADDGPGIEPSVREVLFEPFVTTRRGGREGAGLGLFLAERLVVAHGGRIDVESEPGRGSVFRVRLPAP
jgi:signal transduction histidine kinase